MELKTDSDSGHDIQLNPKILEFIGSYSLGESKIKNYKIHQEKNKKNKITVLITFERQLIYMIMNAFLPTILINIVSIIFSFKKNVHLAFSFEKCFAISRFVLEVITTLRAILKQL